MNNPLRVVLIGGGNVAYHLAKAWAKTMEVEVIQLYNRSLLSEEFQLLNISFTDDLSELKVADVYVVAVSDDAIESVASSLPFSKRLVVHTSGNTSIEKIDNQNYRGVLYPLQSFSKQIEIDFSKVPFCIEAERTEDTDCLKKLANSLSQKIYYLDGQQRSLLHISAVFANNFTNYMLTMSEQICLENNIPFEILSPLMENTFQKASQISPFEAQTGPAKRHDMQTIERHLQLLSGNQKEIYKIITNSILELYGK